MDSLILSLVRAWHLGYFTKTLKDDFVSWYLLTDCLASIKQKCLINELVS